MVDWIALLVSHSLIALAFWRLMSRAELDDEKAPEQRRRPPGFGQPGTLPDRPLPDGTMVERPQVERIGANSRIGQRDA